MFANTETHEKLPLSQQSNLIPSFLLHNFDFFSPLNSSSLSAETSNRSPKTTGFQLLRGPLVWRTFSQRGYLVETGRIRFLLEWLIYGDFFCNEIARSLKSRIMKNPFSSTIQVPAQFPLHRHKEMWSTRANPLLHFEFANCSFFSMRKVSSVITCAEKARRTTAVSDTSSPGDASGYRSFDKKSTKMVRKMGKKEHHLWQKRNSARSGQKALNLVRIISGLPNEKEAVYGTLNKWIAWEAEFPLIAAAKALRILRKKSQWVRVIQVAKWMLSKGQGTTMTTYDSLLLAFDMDCRIDEAEKLWNMILHTHTRSTSKKLFSRMISLYDHHNMLDKVIEVFADMEELGVKPDEDSLRKIARAFGTLGQVDKKKLALDHYQGKWKYIHFSGERVRVRKIHRDESATEKVTN